MKSSNVTISSQSLRQMKGIFRVGNNFIFLKGQEVFRVIGVINHLIPTLRIKCMIMQDKASLKHCRPIVEPIFGDYV